VSFATLHYWWAWVFVVGNGLAGLWALLGHRYPAVRGRWLLAATIFAQVAVAVEAVLGVLVLRVDGREVEQLHVIYGFVSLAAVFILYGYRQQIEQWRFLLYGFGGLFLMGMGIRAMILTPI
jgi:hypothetical protein